MVHLLTHLGLLEANARTVPFWIKALLGVFKCQTIRVGVVARARSKVQWDQEARFHISGTMLSCPYPQNRQEILKGCAKLIRRILAVIQYFPAVAQDVHTICPRLKMLRSSKQQHRIDIGVLSYHLQEIRAFQPRKLGVPAQTLVGSGPAPSPRPARRRAASLATRNLGE